MGQTAKARTLQTDMMTAVFIRIIGELWKYDGSGMKRVAENSNVHYTTLYNWRGGETVYPRLDTICRVAQELGFEITIVRRRHKLQVVK